MIFALLCILAFTGCSHEHKYGEWETIKEPTCKEMGIKERVCSCGESLTMPIAALKHNYGEEWTIDIEPTCTSKGSKSRHCSECDYKADITDINIIEHKWNKLPGESDTPKCTEDVIYKRECAVCHKKDTAKIPAIGHTNSSAVIENKIDATCVEDGSYDSVIYCSVCNDEISREPNTILATGIHKYISVVTPPGVTTEGYTTHTCSSCQDSYTDSYVPATGSLGLSYTVNDDGTTCTITGLGSCTDKEIYINEKIDGYTVSAIGENAFFAQDELTAIHLPSTVKVIAKNAFSRCSALSEIIIPSGVTTIGSSAFQGCSELTEIVIPENVTSIERFAFRDCSKLESIIINGEIEAIEESTFSGCSSLKAIIIPDSVKSIGSGAFEDCSSLVSVTLGNELITVGMSAFEGCTELTRIALPDSVESIGSWAFAYCKKLEAIEIGSGITSIGSLAFYECFALNTIKISSIESWLLINFDFLYSHPFYSSTAAERKLFLGEEECTKVIIPETITAIGGYAFYGCTNIASVTIPEGVKSIGIYAFSKCTSLESVTIPNSVTSIGSSAFENCSKLAFASLGESVEQIGEFAFMDCTELSEIVIQIKVASIAYSAFDNCSKLETVYYTGTAEDWDKILIENYNAELVEATRYYYSETEPADDGNFWHYVEDVPAKWEAAVEE